MDAEATVRDYYDALRDGDPLHPYFLDDERVVKFGIGERLAGFGEIRRGLADQTDRTTDWVVESEDLVVGRAGEAGWFSDDVFMAWTDVEASVRYEFDSRWSGTLLDRNGVWQFAGMHVSTAGGT